MSELSTVAIVYGRCLDIAEELIFQGREEEALAYLREDVLPAIQKTFEEEAYGAVR